MKKVISKNINTIHYDPKTKVLEITFHEGSTYNYHGISPEAYTSFENAKSHGKHFNTFIKDKFLGVKK